MRLMALVVAAGLLWPSSSFSQTRAFDDGNKLYGYCGASNSSDDKVFCAGYVAGISDALQGEKRMCMPVEATVEQAVDVIMNFLRDHPEQRHYTAWSISREALGHAFPCKEQAH